MADFSDFKQELPSRGGSSQDHRERSVELGDHEGLSAQWQQWHDATTLLDKFDDTFACVRAYVRVLSATGEANGLTEESLFKVRVNRSASKALRAHTLFFLAHQMPHESQRQHRLLLLRTAFSLVNRVGLQDLPAGPAEAMSRLCEEALEAGIAPPLVRNFILRHRLVPQGSAVLNWPSEVQIYTLGRFSVLCRGEQLSFSGKSPRKALELLQALIAHGGREVHITVLMQSLWPEESHSNLHNLFDNTLHRLRRILGPTDVLHVNNGKLTLDPTTCWVDAWCFYRLTASCVKGPWDPLAARNPVSTNEALVAWRLYSGHFLQTEVESAWALPYRDRLRNRFYRLVCALGEQMEHAERWGDAIAVYERGLEMDNLAETLYRRLMYCYQKIGEHAEALRVYRRCRELLSVVLNVAPSPTTERLHHQSSAPPQ